MENLSVKSVTDALGCTRAGLAARLGIDRAAVYQWGEFVLASRIKDCRALMKQAEKEKNRGKSFAASSWSKVKLTINLSSMPKTKTPDLSAGV
ncbi:MAG: hypothetical protein VXW65_08440 [Pseudomonadota bacterium]|nr:hypothetical protein [Pseudomonadota bacterium]